MNNKLWNILLAEQNYNNVIIISGSLLSACFSSVDEAIVFSTVCEYLALPLSGAYLSFK